MGEDLSLDGRRDLGLDGRRDLTSSGMEWRWRNQRGRPASKLAGVRMEECMGDFFYYYFYVSTNSHSTGKDTNIKAEG
jgi:hypothetical protein